MLLTQLKDILDIDTRISDMHRELANLYAIRSSMVEPEYGTSQNQTKELDGIEKVSPDISTWCRQQYGALVDSWNTYDIKIPSYKHLQNRLKQARSVIEELSKTKPEIKDNLSIILVPPTKLIGLPLSIQIRKGSRSNRPVDYINPDLAMPAISKKWQLLVAYTAVSGLYLGSPETILTSKNYMIAGHDTRALGLLEYAAMSLQLADTIDNKSWTILLKGTPRGGQLPCATYQDGRLRFDVGDIDSVFGDDRFRPAVAL